MFSHSACLLFALISFSGTQDAQLTSLSYNQLNAGQKFEIRTVDRTFRGQLVDRATGECLMSVSTDGANFTPARTVYLLGATAGSQDRQMFVLMHDVKVGLKMELGMGDLEQRHRYITGDVESISLED